MSRRRKYTRFGPNEAGETYTQPSIPQGVHGIELSGETFRALHLYPDYEENVAQAEWHHAWDPSVGRLRFFLWACAHPIGSFALIDQVSGVFDTLQEARTAALLYVEHLSPRARRNLDHPRYKYEPADMRAYWAWWQRGLFSAPVVPPKDAAPLPAEGGKR